MRDIELFQMAFGLTPPWQVESCVFNPETKRFDIMINFPRGSTFTCPECGTKELTRASESYFLLFRKKEKGYL